MNGEVILDLNIFLFCFPDDIQNLWLTTVESNLNFDTAEELDQFSSYWPFVLRNGSNW